MGEANPGLVSLAVYNRQHVDTRRASARPDEIDCGAHNSFGQSPGSLRPDVGRVLARQSRGHRRRPPAKCSPATRASSSPMGTGALRRSRAGWPRREAGSLLGARAPEVRRRGATLSGALRGGLSTHGSALRRGVRVWASTPGEVGRPGAGAFVAAVRECALRQGDRLHARAWPGPTRSLEDARTALDNNATEHALRAWSSAERITMARALALFSSLIESAKLCGVEPKAYLLCATGGPRESRRRYAPIGAADVLIAGRPPRTRWRTLA